MSTGKRAMQLTAGIIGTIGYALFTALAVLGVVGIIMIIAGLGELEIEITGSSTLTTELGVLSILVSILWLALAITLLVLSINLLKNPNKNGKFNNRTGLVVASLIFNCLYGIYAILSASLLGIILSAVVILFLIISLCIKNTYVQPSANTYPADYGYAQPVPPAPPAPPARQQVPVPPAKQVPVQQQITQQAPYAPPAPPAQMGQIPPRPPVPPAPQARQAQQIPPAPPVPPVPPAQKMQTKPQEETIEARIARIKKLTAEGIISEEEAKHLILEEIKKQ